MGGDKLGQKVTGIVMFIVFIVLGGFILPRLLISQPNPSNTSIDITVTSAVAARTQTGLFPTDTPIFPTTTIHTEGATQALTILTDTKFEIQAFSIQPDEQVEMPVWHPNSTLVLVDHFVGTTVITPTQMLPLRELWVLNLDGGGQKIGNNVLAGAWSPDGQHIAYLQRSVTARDYTLWSATYPALGKQTLASNVGLQTPFWLDNQTIAYATVKGDIISVDISSSATQTLTALQVFTDAIQGVNFSISPNGTWLLARTTETKLALQSLSTSDAAWIVPSDPQIGYSFIVGNIAWTSDNQIVAFTAYHQKLGEVIHLVNVATRTEKDIAFSLMDRVQMPRFLSWSPDNQMLLFTARNQDTRKTNMYVINRDGSGLRNLSHDPDVYVRAAFWSPNGHYIFYSEYTDVDLTRRPRLLEVNQQ